MLYPIIPETVEKVLKIFDLDSKNINLESIADHNILKSGNNLNKIGILFAKIEKND